MKAIGSKEYLEDSENEDASWHAPSTSITFIGAGEGAPASNLRSDDSGSPEIAGEGINAVERRL